MASSSSSGPVEIYLGPWVNWEAGRFKGSQITLSSLNAQILSSFLGIFVTVVGVQLWQIISFAAHQLRSAKRHHDVPAQQLQVVLRNTSSPWSAAKAIIWQLWAWRKRPVKSFRRSSSWIVLALLYATGFAVISVFASSEITKFANTARLLKSNNCGVYNTTALDFAANQAWVSVQEQDANAAALYARSCYPNNSSTSAVVCDAYATSHLPFSSTHAGCPINESECAFVAGAPYVDFQPLQIDTGLLDSRKHLGINANNGERMSFRKLTTCSPVSTHNYSQAINITSYNAEFYGATPGDVIMVVDIGPVPPRNYTYIWNSHTEIDGVGYTLQALPATTGWIPIPAFNRTDADVVSVTLSANSMKYPEACDDPLFSAHDANNLTYPDGEQYVMYDSDYGARILVCAEQYQFCNPNNNQCTNLTSLEFALAEADDLDVSRAQQIALFRIEQGMLASGVFSAIAGRGSGALLAQDTVHDLEQYPLPPNQWEHEATSWFESGLARIQMLVQSYASRASDTNITGPAELGAEGENMCNNQVVLTTQGTVSFSTLGLGIVLCLGMVIIIAGFVIEPITTFIQKHSGRGLQRHRDWVLNETLQLQRLALESRGVGPWSDPAGSVPVTEKGVMFAGWRDRDLEDGTVTAAESLQSDQYEGPPAEAKPFIAEQSHTAYHSIPTTHVEEY